MQNDGTKLRAGQGEFDYFGTVCCSEAEDNAEDFVREAFDGELRKTSTVPADTGFQRHGWPGFKCSQEIHSRLSHSLAALRLDHPSEIGILQGHDKVRILLLLYE